MKRSFFLPAILMILSSISGLFAQESPLPAFCLSETEQLLAQKINQYRVRKGLQAIPISKSLSFVARTHCKDLEQTYTHSGKCNLHSWSGNGNWTSCCYTADHRKAECMWSKPSELTSYTGDGFEIAYYNSLPPESAEAYAQDILDSWKGSPGHHNLIINRGTWDDVKWNAMGIGVWNGYATVWFGKVADPAGEPEYCN